MIERKLLTIVDSKNIYQELAETLYPHRDKEKFSIEFIVEGTLEDPKIGIRYPGKKVKKRDLKIIRSNSALWGNLYDFVVIPYIDGKEVEEINFTFEEILRDFEENKKNCDEFWERIEEIYYGNQYLKNPPELPGINSKLYLLVLKWIWIQEDFNYKLDWNEVKSPIKYVLETRTGTRTRKGAGRCKFFAALILLKKYFTFNEVKKIIPLY